MSALHYQLLVLFIYLFALVRCQQSAAEPMNINKEKIAEELTSLTFQWVDAIKNRDREKLDFILSDDLVFHLSDGELWGKDQLLKCYIENSPTYDESGVYDLEVHIYSKDLAVVTGKAKWITKDTDGVTDERSVWSNMYRKEGHDWKCIFGMGGQLADK